MLVHTYIKLRNTTTTLIDQKPVLSFFFFFLFSRRAPRANLSSGHVCSERSATWVLELVHRSATANAHTLINRYTAAPHGLHSCLLFLAGSRFVALSFSVVKLLSSSMAWVIVAAAGITALRVSAIGPQETSQKHVHRYAEEGRHILLNMYDRKKKSVCRLVYAFTPRLVERAVNHDNKYITTQGLFVRLVVR